MKKSVLVIPSTYKLVAPPPEGTEDSSVPALRRPTTRDTVDTATTDRTLWKLKMCLARRKVMGLTTRYDAGFGRHEDKDYVLEYEEV